MSRIYVPTMASGPGTVKVSVGVGPASVGLTVGAEIVAPPVTYTGAYTVTPSDSAQTLATSGKVLGGDITVNPVPNNYGRITWDGSVLTVS